MNISQTTTFLSDDIRCVKKDRDNGMKETHFASERENMFVCKSTF